MLNLMEKLSNTTYFVDNEFLSKYVVLVERNKITKQRNGLTNSHHIIPRYWFKMNGVEVDNSPSNLVNLPYREHILAHYYLCLCTEGKLKYANELALISMTARKKLKASDRALIGNLPLYNNIYEDYKGRKKKNESL